MSSRRDQVEEQVRLAIDAMPDAPVRWERVERKTRLRKWSILVAFAFVGLALTVLVATTFLAGKSAFDPSFSPPLISSSDLSAEFHEPAYGHGLVPLSKFHSDERESAERMEGLENGDLGYVFEVSLSGDVKADESLLPRWRIRHRGDSEGLPLTLISGVRGAGDDRLYDVWVERPPRSGQFVVDFSLVARHRVVLSEVSSPLHVVTRGFLHRYRTKTYSGGIPEGWRVDSDYKPEPGHRFVTRLEGPHGMSVLVDTTPNVTGDPADSAISLEDLLRNGEERYKRLSFARRSFGGPAFEWCFVLGDHLSTDIFFYREGDGYAVLAESPEARFREARLVARTVARTIQGTPPQALPR